MSEYIPSEKELADAQADANSAPPDLQRGQRRNSRTAGIAPTPPPMPSSVESEQAILGCCLLSPKDCILETMSKIKGREIWFDIRHAIIWEAIVEIYVESEFCDIVMLHQALKDAGQLDASGGLAYLAGLPDSVSSAAGLDYYLEIALEKYRCRFLIQTCTGAVSRLYAEAGTDFKELIDGVESEILNLRKLSEVNPLPGVRELVADAIAMAEEAVARQGRLAGIGSGFRDVDDLLGGFQKSQMILIGGRPSSGKSSALMQFAEHIAIELKIPIGIFSLEMSSRQMILKAVCTRARVNVKHVQQGFITDSDFPKLTGAAGKWSNAPIYIDDTSGLSVLELRSRARKMKEEKNVQIIGIDYLQMLSGGAKRYRSKEEELADVSKGVKALCKELDIPIIALCQLNREVEKRTSGRPKSSDLRGSGSLEADADIIGLLYREKEVADPTGDGSITPMALAIDKNRMGPCGEVKLSFWPSYTRFESVSKIDAGDAPNYEAGGRV